MLKSITFLEYQDSALDAGEYTIRLDQHLDVMNTHGSGTLNETLARTLVVQGKRFALDPADIDSKFPAPGSNGDFTHILPHIILNLNTLPWQRSPDGVVRSGRVVEKNEDGKVVDPGEPNYPWLALVVFNETDGIPIPKQITLKELYENRANLAPWIRTQAGDDIATLDAFLEYGEKEDDPVSVIDIERTTLESILPSPADLAFLAHCRGESDSNSLLPTIVANRMPKSGERHSVHLVSLMYCYETIDPTNATEVSLVGTGDDFRLVSLHNWTFYCEDTGDFRDQLVTVDQNLFRLSSESTNATVKQYFEDGFILLPHHLRIGRDVASLYRGPLSAGTPSPPALTLPVESADHLLLYDQQSGMLDVSYAAAWTLGRQLALEDKTFALDLYKYNRRQSIKAKRAVAMAEVSNLAIGGKDYADDDDNLNTDLTDKIQDWLDQYQTLANIPFHYLVPQETLLPGESIRFFQIDPFWITCLQHGALSIGGEIASATAISPNPVPNRWGFYLRSKVVSEFPKLRIEGYADFKAKPPIDPDHRTDLEDRTNPIAPEIIKLSEQLLFVYFDQAIQTVDIFLDPVNLYFGFKEEKSVADETILMEIKDLKNTDGSELSEEHSLTLTEWRDASTRVLDISTFAQKMQAKLIEVTADAEFDLFTSADFALQMVEGAPRVRFYVKNS